MLIETAPTTPAEDALAAAEHAANRWLDAHAAVGQAASRTDDALEALDLLTEDPAQKDAHAKLSAAYALLCEARTATDAALAAARARRDEAIRPVTAAEAAAAAIASL